MGLDLGSRFGFRVPDLRCRRLVLITVDYKRRKAETISLSNERKIEAFNLFISWSWPMDRLSFNVIGLFSFLLF